MDSMNGNVNGIYQRLDKLGQEIRLLEIANSPSPDGTPEYVLSTVSLNTNPQFDALSYVWGNPTSTEEINVNGCTMKVTTSLASALRLVQGTTTTSRRLWVDAVCINQADIEERNHQVSLMKAVYSSAKLVIGWIGEENEQIARGMRGITQVANTVANLSGDELHGVAWLAKLPTPRVAGLGYPISQDSEDNRSMWLDIESFFSVPYWRRVWIFQELVLGRTVTIFCGRQRILLDTLLLVSLRFHEVFHYQSTNRESKDPRGPPASEHYTSQLLWLHIVSSYPAMMRMVRMFRVVMVAKQERLQLHSDYCAWDMCHSLGELQATDPKDHIYGLIGVSGLNITPDYSTDTTVATVYQDYTAAWLDHLHSKNCATLSCREFQAFPLRFLGLAGIGILENTCSLPTWAPNYHDLEKGVKRTCPSQEDCAADYGVFGSGVEKSFIFGATLSVAGVAISSVSDLGPQVSVEGKGDSAKLFRPEELLSYISESLDPSAVYPDGQMILRAFVQLIHALRPDDGNSRLLFLLLFLRSLRGDLTVRDILRILKLESDEKLLSFLTDDGQPLGILASYAQVGVHLMDSLEAASFMIDETLSEILNGTGALLAVSWRLFRTKAGWLGLGPRGLKEGDTVCILDGLPRPAILRMVDNHHIFVSDCIVSGLMYGEAAKLVKAGTVAVQRMEII